MKITYVIGELNENGIIFYGIPRTVPYRYVKHWGPIGSDDLFKAEGVIYRIKAMRLVSAHEVNLWLVPREGKP